MLMRPHLAGILARGDRVLYLWYAGDYDCLPEMRRTASDRESSRRGGYWRG